MAVKTERERESEFSPCANNIEWRLCNDENEAMISNICWTAKRLEASTTHVPSLPKRCFRRRSHDDRRNDAAKQTQSASKLHAARIFP